MASIPYSEGTLASIAPQSSTAGSSGDSTQIPFTAGTLTPLVVTDPVTLEGLSLKEDKANRGVANGYAPLDQNLKVPQIHLPSHKITHAASGSDPISPEDIGAQPAGNYEITALKNTPNGYAGLNASGKILVSALPDESALETEAIAFAIALG